MANHDDLTRRSIAALRDGEWENAYHRLIEIGGSATTLLAEAFRNEREPGLRRLLLRILWQTRSNDVVPLLMEGLEDEEPNVWKEAIDGLVALGGPHALEALRAARPRSTSPKAEWIDEAIGQIVNAPSAPTRANMLD